MLFDPEFQPLADVLRENLPGIRWVALEASDSQPDWVHSRTYEELLAAAEPAAVDYTTYDENALAELFYTSGSTGRPKGVMLSHPHALSARPSMPCSPRAGGRAMSQPIRCAKCTRSPCFTQRLGTAPYDHLCRGAPHYREAFRPRRSLRADRAREGDRVLDGPNDGDHDGQLSRPGRLRLEQPPRSIRRGGAPSAALIGEIEEKLGCRAFAGYGMTETSPVAAIAHIKDTLGEISEPSAFAGKR